MTDLTVLKAALGALEDITSGWRYIREVHGDLYGVGWDRAQSKAEDAINALRDLITRMEAKPVVDGLLPCPFCGSNDVDPQAALCEQDGVEWSEPGCLNCGAAHKEWNQRAITPAMREPGMDVERAAEIIHDSLRANQFPKWPTYKDLKGCTQCTEIARDIISAMRGEVDWQLWPDVAPQRGMQCEIWLPDTGNQFTKFDSPDNRKAPYFYWCGSPKKVWWRYIKPPASAKPRGE